MTIDNRALSDAFNKRIEEEVVHRLDIQTESDWFRALVKELAVEALQEIESCKNSPIFICDNCGHEGPRDSFPQAVDLDQRIDTYGILTDKECPKCGALSYPQKGAKK